MVAVHREQDRGVVDVARAPGAAAGGGYQAGQGLEAAARPKYNTCDPERKGDPNQVLHRGLEARAQGDGAEFG